MIKEAKSIVGAKVLEFDSGEVLAILNLPIINPDTGVVEAFWVKPLNLPLKDAVVQVGDIIEFKKNMYIKSESVIADPADVIRISEILSDGRDLFGMEVKGESGRSYGKVMDLSFDAKSSMLKSILTQRRSLAFFRSERRIFPYERIVKVLPSYVLVDDSDTQKVALGDVAEPAAG